MKEWQKLIGAVIIAAAMIGAALILSDAIIYLQFGKRINKMNEYWWIFALAIVVAICSKQIDKALAKLIVNEKKRAIAYCITGVVSLSIIGVLLFKAASAFAGGWSVAIGIAPVSIFIISVGLGTLAGRSRNKKAWFVRILLLIVYCIPFAFLSVNGDAASGTMLFYGIMIAGFASLCWGALKTKNIAVLYLGNLLSFSSSYAAAKLSGLEPMGYYFKPFTSYSIIAAISIIVVIVQTIIVLIYVKKKKN